MESHSPQDYCQCMADKATAADDMLVCGQCSLDIRPTTLPTGTLPPDPATTTDADQQLAVDKAVYAVLRKRSLLRDRCIRNPNPEALRKALVKYAKKYSDVKQLGANHGREEVVASVSRLIQQDVLSSPEEAQKLFPDLFMDDSAGPSIASGSKAEPGQRTALVEGTHVGGGMDGAREELGTTDGKFTYHRGQKDVCLHLLHSSWRMRQWG
jgi:hypothetical protein